MTESASRDLSGWSLFPERDQFRDDFSDIRSNRDYLTSSLTIDTTTQAFFQTGDGVDEDVDTFVMHLDAGDIYEVVFSTAEMDQFTSNRAMTVFGVNGGFVDLILNEYGDTFPPSGTLTTQKFTVQQSGDYLLFAKFRHSGGPVTASYGLTLEKVEDVTSWDISLSRSGMGARAFLSSSDETIAAGTQITISLTFATSNLTFDDVRMLVPGSMSRSVSSIENSTTVSIDMTLSQAVNMRNLLEVNFRGPGDAASIEASRVFVSVNGASPVVVAVGTAGDDVLSGDIGDDRISGWAGDDTLSGSAGDDMLDGGAGSDLMSGGAGDDVYRVDALGDVVREFARRGNDTVQSTIDYALGDNVENLALLGSDAINGAGNGLANMITGNARANALTGGAGNDTLRGGAGDDTLSGGPGNDWLDGGAGADTMSGGAGDDVYRVDAGGDAVREYRRQGIDTVQSAIGHTLGDNVENLTLIGRFTIDGAGNGLDNAITGNAGDNTLNGMAGNDTLNSGAGDDRLDGGADSDLMAGGAGDDIYFVDAWGDAVREYARRGADTVQSAIGHTLADNLEKLTLLGTDAINGAGNGAANAITGNVGANTLKGMAGEDTLTGGAGDDRLEGGAGADRLTGGTGEDRFVLVALSDSTVRAAGRDTIADFSLAEHDLIHLGAIDANARRGGNQSFSYLGDAAFTGQAGELSARIVTGGSMISGDVDGDRIADFALRLDDRIALGADSFIL